jgi:hypothetical protein
LTAHLEKTVLQLSMLPKFIPISSYHKEEATIKSTKAHYLSNPKPSFNPKREVRKETPKPREEAFIWMFCGHADHFDEFCFRRKRIERRRVEYARNSYRDELIDFPPHSYSRILPRLYSRALPHTFSRALHQFTHGANHRSYDFGPRDNRFEPRALITAHVLVVVIVSRVGLVFLLGGHSPTLS